MRRGSLSPVVPQLSAASVGASWTGAWAIRTGGNVAWAESRNRELLEFRDPLQYLHDVTKLAMRHTVVAMYLANVP